MQSTNEGHAAMSSVNIATGWRTAARLLLGGNPLGAAAEYKRIGSLPDQADALTLAAKAALTSRNPNQARMALSRSAATGTPSTLHTSFVKRPA